MKTVRLAGLAFTVTDDDLVITREDEPLTPDEFADARASDMRVPATRTAYDKYLVAFEPQSIEVGRTTVADALIRVPEIAAVLRYSTIQEDE